MTTSEEKSVSAYGDKLKNIHFLKMPRVSKKGATKTASGSTDCSPMGQSMKINSIRDPSGSTTNEDSIRSRLMTPPINSFRAARIPLNKKLLSNPNVGNQEGDISNGAILKTGSKKTSHRVFKSLGGNPKSRE